MSRLLVTVGSDGFTDWVKLPSGQRLSLGSVSVLSFVSRLAQGRRMAKRTLDEYLRGREAMLNVDEESMWAILAPKRRRWATDGSFIAPDQRTTNGDEARIIMTTIQQQLTAIENHIQAMDKAAAAGVPPEKMQEGWGILANLTGQVNPTAAADFGFEEKTIVTPAEVGGHAPAVAIAAEPVEGLTFDTYQGNNDLASTIIAQSEETSETIDRLASEGKKFDHQRARTDLHAVTSKVAGILDGTSLTEPWVAEDLQKLATRSAHLHGLFHAK